MTKQIKKIGIVGWNIGDNSFGATKAYLNFLNTFGNVQILTPQQDIVEDLDLLVLPGGRDVNPLRYGGIPDWYNSEPNSLLEYFDQHKLPQYIEAGVPVFGICRGFQTLNVYFGGSLTQNYVHEQSTKHRGELAHEVRIVNFEPVEDYNSKGKKIVTDRLKVNSLHHQVIFEENLSEVLIPVLQHSTDDVVEGFIHNSLPIAGVQYHPEEIFDAFSNKIINDLLNYQITNEKNNEVLSSNSI